MTLGAPIVTLTNLFGIIILMWLTFFWIVIDGIKVNLVTLCGAEILQCDLGPDEDVGDLSGEGSDTLES